MTQSPHSKLPLGPFELDARVGAGGMGEVWRAVHRPSGAPVAVKLVTAQRARNELYLSAFRREVHAVAALDHPAIVTVFDHGRVDVEAARGSGGALVEGVPYLVMELCDGSLDRNSVEDWAGLRQVLATLLDALTHAHARGIVHRDLKPANILVSRSSAGDVRLKLTDFGIAHALAAGDVDDVLHRELSPRSGTPETMAPEQYLGRWRDFGPWTDLYAVGCLAYLLACGRPPFEAESNAAMAHLHINVAPPALRPRFAVPEQLAAWIARLMEKDPSDRYPLAADALFALHQMGPAVSSGGRLTTTAADGPTSLALTMTALDVEEGAAPPDVSVTAGGASMTGPAPIEPPPQAEDWRMDAASSSAGRLRGVGLSLHGVRGIPLAGREVERDLLWQALGRVRACGEPHVVVLKGPSGYGKSRLAQWLCRRAHETGAGRSLRAVHDALNGPADGLLPMAMRHLRCEAMDFDRAVQRVRASLGPGPQARSVAALVAGGDEGGRRFDSPSERYAVLASMLRSMSSRRPVIVWLDDVQWGLDALGFAQFVRRRAQDPGAILFVLTAQQEALAQRSAERSLLAEIAVDAEVLEIGALADGPHARLVEELLGLQRDVAVRVEERTAGNPLFAVQLVGDWVRRGLLVPGPDGFRVRDGADVDLPQDLREVWHARIAEVLSGRPASDGVALEVAAVLGRAVEPAEWADVCGRVGVSASVALVPSLLSGGLAGPGDSEDGWAFVHGMLRESLLRRARDAGRLSDHHRACAAMLADEDAPERLGLQLVAAGDFEAALNPLAEAVARCLDAGDYRPASALLAERGRAAERCGLADSDVRWGLGWVLQARLARVQGQPADAVEWALKADAAGRAHGWPVVAAHAAYEVANIGYRSLEYEDALARLEPAVAQLAGLDEPFLMGRCRVLLGMVLGHLGQGDRAVATLEQACEDCRAAGDLGGQGSATLALGCLARDRGQLAEAEEIMSRAADCFEAAGDRWGLGQSLLNLGSVRLREGDLFKAFRHFRSALRRYRAMSATRATFVQAQLGLIIGDYSEVEAGLMEMKQSYDERKNPIMSACLLICMLGTSACRRDWAAWDRFAAESMPVLERVGFVDIDIATMACCAGDLAREGGELERAGQAYRFGMAQLAALGHRPEAVAVKRLIAAVSTQVPMGTHTKTG